jgi:hypothetical protein
MASTLVPGLSGAPCVAYQEIIVWVTSCGWNEPPLIPHSVRGALGFDTSASTVLVAPCSRSKASWATGWAAQLAWRAAQAGTATGLGSMLGDGDGLGLSAGLGLGLGLGLGDVWVGDGVEDGARGPLGVQPASASRDARTITPFLTGGWNERGHGRVTGVSAGRKVAQDNRSGPR